MDKDDTKKNPLGEEFTEIEKEMRTRFALLPEDIQKTIISSEYQMKLFELAKKTKLTYEQLGTLEMETTMMLIGMTPPEDFQGDLQEQLKLDAATAGEMVKDINEQITMPIRASLQKIYTTQNDINNAVSNALAPDSTKQDTVMKSAGIEIQKSGPSDGTLKQAVRTQQSGMTGVQSSPLASRTNILNGIEHPTESKPSFVGKQLAGSFSLPTKETTYIPKPAAPIPPPAPKGSTIPQAPGANMPPVSDAPTSDPYREAF